MHERFGIVKKGYNPVEVEAYIDKLEGVVTSYKEKDTAIKNAIVNAQIAADNIVGDAETKSQRVLNESADKLNSIFDNISKQRQVIRQFQDDYSALITKYLQHVNEQDMETIFGKLDELETYLSEQKNSFHGR